MENKLIPKQGTLERILLDKLQEMPEGVTYLDLIGTGITEENIEQLIKNLQSGMYESESDDELEFDA